MTVAITLRVMDFTYIDIATNERIEFAIQNHHAERDAYDKSITRSVMPTINPSRGA